MPALHLIDHAQWPTLAAFIHRHNRRPDGRVRCLHAEHGFSTEDQADELRALAPAEGRFVAALDEGTLLGVIGAELDPRAGRAWLRGPLVAPTADAAALRRALIDTLLSALPQTQRFDAFPQLDETPLLDAYASAGFERLQQHHVMGFESAADAAPPPWPTAVHDASGAEAEQAGALHARCFPDTYLGAQDIAAARRPNERLLVVRHRAEVAGYLLCQHQPTDHEVYVDFIAVDEASRGKGVGRALLDAAVHWAVAGLGLRRVSLTVREDRSPALGLYTAAGFHEAAAGAHLALRRGQAQTPAASSSR